MKITKKILKKIIQEEKEKLSFNDYSRDFGSNIVRQQKLQEQKEAYPSGYYGSDSSVGVAESRLEDALYEMMGALMGDMGMTEDEAAQIILNQVKDTLGF